MRMIYQNGSDLNVGCCDCNVSGNVTTRLVTSVEKLFCEEKKTKKTKNNRIYIFKNGRYRWQNLGRRLAWIIYISSILGSVLSWPRDLGLCFNDFLYTSKHYCILHCYHMKWIEEMETEFPSFKCMWCYVPCGDRKSLPVLHYNAFFIFLSVGSLRSFCHYENMPI